MLSISTQKYPNNLFTSSAEFLNIVKKLFWSCNPSNKTRFGYKRSAISQHFPNLCAYYDDFFYNNENLSEAILKEDERIKQMFEVKRVILDPILDTIADLVVLANMNESATEMFKSEVLSYCQANLVRIVAYQPSPYVTTYFTDQVRKRFKAS